MRQISLLLACLALFACAEAPERPAQPPAPAGEAMIAAAHPDAVEAGLEILRAGGSAVDAAIAVQTALSLVEPQSSGIGGGAFLVHFDAATGAVTVYDGRETAPAGAGEDLWLGEDGQPIGFREAWSSGRAAGAPGVIALLAMAHEDHGRLPWADGFAPAIRLAEEGFEIGPRLSALIGRVGAVGRLAEHPASRAYFFDEAGAPLPVGFVRDNPEYAATLRAIAAGWRNFYEGEIADGIIAAANEPPLPGALSLEDLRTYRPVRREALCRPYRVWTVCGAPPPSSGGVAVNAILGLLEPFDMSATGPETAEGWRRFIEASRLAYADRDRYVGDADFVFVPADGLIDRDYLRERARLIDRDTAIETVTHGVPPGAGTAGADDTPDNPGTSHFVVVDGWGNVVSMTTTVEAAFGNQRMTGGFLLNNQMTDFAFTAQDAEGRPLANAPAPGKRPRSSMSPTIVFDEDGAFVLATGSPGGNSIIAYTAKTLVAMLDWGMSPQQAAALPNVVARGDVVNIEDGFDPAILAELRDIGFAVDAGRGENSGIHIVRRLPDGSLTGAADPRREGAARQP
ncbi:MAG: gamma-glutamyltransferase [Maricaulaceae bacterium]|nr:gamma-glutamyltransferase [Maricaulaceae bacterium]